MAREACSALSIAPFSLAQKDYLCWGVLREVYFRELRTCEVRRIPLLGTSVNSDVALRHRALPGGIMGYQDRRLEKERSWQRKARRYTRLTTSLQVEIGFGGSARSGSQER